MKNKTTADATPAEIIAELDGLVESATIYDRSNDPSVRAEGVAELKKLRISGNWKIIRTRAVN